MNLLTGIILGCIMTMIWVNTILSCENCENLKNWCMNEQYKINICLYDCEAGSDLWWYYKGKAESYQEVIQRIEKSAN